MRAWLVRGGVMAVVQAVAETVRADYGVAHPTSRTLFEAVTLGVLVGVAAVWGAVDKWRGVEDAGRTWLIASLIAGWGAAILGVVGKSIFVDQTGVADLGSALTGGAAFTALLVLIPAAIGLGAGTWIRATKADDEEDATEADRPGRGRVRRRPTAAE
ncbi:B-4DMT family transporter [Actinophytocola sp.]|uniref:B-4DMT family transporter n=1 Tax=Actinophytocola sp. TaxID=1872138 RepID=UPI00389AA507